MCIGSGWQSTFLCETETTLTPASFKTAVVSQWDPFSNHNNKAPNLVHKTEVGLSTRDKSHFNFRKCIPYCCLTHSKNEFYLYKYNSFSKLLAKIKNLLITVLVVCAHCKHSVLSIPLIKQLLGSKESFVFCFLR